MNIKAPRPCDYAALRALWQEAFLDSDAFLDYFWANAFSPDRTRCLYFRGEPAAALYWFDCEYGGGRVAYLYAIATSAKHRGRGFCSALLSDTHAHLASLGYIASMLVPASDKLFDFYSFRGYKVCTYINSIEGERGNTPFDIRRIDTEEYAKLRREMLPRDSVIEEGACLAVLAEGAELYRGEGVLLACRKRGSSLYGIELLGDSSNIPGILDFLNCESGIFNTPGGVIPFSMICSLHSKDDVEPKYFGLALD